MTLDQLIHDANSEISHLRNKLASELHTKVSMRTNGVIAFEIDHASLGRKNQELIEAYNEKSRSYTKSQAAYDSLKRRLIQTDFIAAATDIANRNVYSPGADLHNDPLKDDAQSNLGLQQKPNKHFHSARNLHSRVREGSSSSNETLSKLHDLPSTAGFAQPPHKGTNQANISRLQKLT